MTLHSIAAYVLQFDSASLWQLFPLEARKRLAILAGQHGKVPGIHLLSMTILRDWAKTDVDAYHRFLWSNHLGYANFYEKTNKFGVENLQQTRRMLFEDLTKFLLRHDKLTGQTTNITSIFEVGCASGYLLRSVETDMFPETKILEGIDIDKYAIAKGVSYLNRHFSKIRLFHGDLGELDQIMGKRKYDLILCAGVLMYLHEQSALNVIQVMLKHCNCLVVLTGLAHPVVDNAELERSETRVSDGTFFHNFDKMVKKAGGKIFFRRWEGSKTFDSQTVYFIFCRPGSDEDAFSLVHT
jgi:SAM-dependent methyltransferase